MTLRIEGDLRERQGNLKKGIVVEPYCRVGIANFGRYTRVCEPEPCGREEVEVKGGEGQNDEVELRMNQKGSHLMGFLSSRCGRVCLEGEK